ncbi:hypothetical protein ACRWQL_12475 [Shewanella sp. HL-SH4]|jgi:hypothetical protein|uniref:hypothetical protein n=1 Tax=Shewanella TaxID=22 RepID=UPI001CF86941|nr:hypothetical protein [Shewanella glacialimarina]UCX03405.1 hypothetical protein FJ709_02045 [Shewanella glacialimarina]
MYNTVKKQLWVGELRTARGNTIVIHDGQLPEASKGRIYLFNTVRNVIIEYVEDIVKVNLHDLDEAQTKAALAEFGDAWQVARAEFMAKQQTRIDLSKVPDTAPPKKAKPAPEPDEIADGDDIDVFDDADDSDDDFDMDDGVDD